MIVDWIEHFSFYALGHVGITYISKTKSRNKDRNASKKLAVALTIYTHAGIRRIWRQTSSAIKLFALKKVMCTHETPRICVELLFAKPDMDIQINENDKNKNSVSTYYPRYYRTIAMNILYTMHNHR